MPTDPNRTAIDRRTFIKSASAATAALALGTGATPSSAADPSPDPRSEIRDPHSLSRASGQSRKRVAIVGVGGRSRMYRDAIQGPYKDHAQLVAFCDTNPGRLALAQRVYGDATKEPTPPPAYPAEDFGKMLAETKPDAVIVITTDCFHHEYIVKTLDAGLDVITEKPLTNTPDRCQAIVDAVRRNDRHARVTFNYRYSPPRTQVKDILMSGEIGDVLSVDFHWMLNTHHGADYFRRWHAWKKFSQGLMLHKATHHFDLANWWLSAAPVEVMAMGKREFYTSATAKRMGLTGAHDRCHTCPESDKCSFYLDLAADNNLKALYLDNEKYDGYYRDQCVWRDDHDIEDTMNVLVKYDTGVTMAYSLNAFNAWEGYTIAFNGTKGRLEHTAVEATYISGTATTQGAILPNGVTTTIIPLRGEARRVTPWTGTGGHGGGDTVLLDDLFLPNPPKDKYLRAADERAGAASILIGCAANVAFKTRQPVRIHDLVNGVDRPAYPEMPTHESPVPMPPRRTPGGARPTSAPSPSTTGRPKTHNA